MELSAAYLDVQIEADGAAGRQGGRKVPPNSNVGGVKMVGEGAHLLALRGVAHGKASLFAPLSSSAPFGSPHRKDRARHGAEVDLQQREDQHGRKVDVCQAILFK